MRAIILADGPAKRWEDYPTPKHLIVLRGEVLLHRTVRQLQERGIFDIWITTHDPRYAVPGANCYAPPYNEMQLDQFFACRELWQGYPDVVVYLYGDVFFTEGAMDTIVQTPVEDFVYFQRTGESQITQKKWKEGFAMKTRDHLRFLWALTELRDAIFVGIARENHHQIQGHLEGHGFGLFWGIGPHGVEINDATDDFDVPEDIDIWKLWTLQWFERFPDERPTQR